MIHWRAAFASARIHFSTTLLTSLLRFSSSSIDIACCAWPWTDPVFASAWLYALTALSRPCPGRRRIQPLRHLTRILFVPFAGDVLHCCGLGFARRQALRPLPGLNWIIFVETPDHTFRNIFLPVRRQLQKGGLRLRGSDAATDVPHPQLEEAASRFSPAGKARIQLSASLGSFLTNSKRPLSPMRTDFDPWEESQSSAERGSEVLITSHIQAAAEIVVRSGLNLIEQLRRLVDVRIRHCLHNLGERSVRSWPGGNSMVAASAAVTSVAVSFARAFSITCCRADSSPPARARRSPPPDRFPPGRGQCLASAFSGGAIR